MEKTDEKRRHSITGRRMDGWKKDALKRLMTAASASEAICNERRHATDATRRAYTRRVPRVTSTHQTLHPTSSARLKNLS